MNNVLEEGITVEDVCKHLLQRQIRITVDRRKLLRRGLLILFNIKDHVITFSIKTHKGVIRTYEIFYPFNTYINTQNNTATFSYEHTELPISSDDIVILAKKSKSASILYDKCIVIEYE